MEATCPNFRMPSVERESNHLQAQKGTDLWPDFKWCEWELNAHITENKGCGIRITYLFIALKRWDYFVRAEGGGLNQRRGAGLSAMRMCY